jgi:hypothetical protein
MSTTHTPGPWRAEYDPQGYYRIVYNDRGNWLAEVHDDDEPEAAKADAALIAAAPELLAALSKSLASLKVIAPHNRYPDGTVIPGDSELIREINAAIAKATGSDQ